MTTITGEILTHIDEQTGREVRRYPYLPELSRMIYFRMPRQLPGGRLLILGKGEDNGALWLAFNAESGEAEPLPVRGNYLHLREADGMLWTAEDRVIRKYSVPEGTLEQVAELPEELPYRPVVMTCDGRHAILYRYDVREQMAPPNTMDAAAIWAFLNRDRDGGLYAYDLQTGSVATLVELQGMMPIHPDPSPVDPALLKYSHDKYDAHCQRIWTAQLDGALTKIRPQEWNELVTHEFWWPDGQLIGYKYQDRRNDPTVTELPWAEYSPEPTRFGLADLSGREVYLSDPLNHYHTHLSPSPDGSMLCGEGTDGHSFVYAARFSRQSTKVEFIPLATVHTEYLPFRAQGVNCGYTRDNRWLVYNDSFDGRRQVCAVRVEL
ncbi:MAG: hypothetical protein ACYDCO_04775 [Armatimonadota bacterium]